ncbi:MAG: biotin--[acetyl-CoA-carboxylase] ligase [Opitutae bacterium]|nr:biotin--[acetyl-CoA-carboxylase] ligase [Opitutae bacterium]
MSKYPPGKRKSVPPAKGKARVKKTENPSSYVLRMLLAASPHYVSGSIMAQKLKMSRVGVWSRVDKLRQAGLSIDASQNRGYRLVAEPNLLNQPLLEAWLKECRKSCKVFVHDELDSTNSEAERLLANGEKAPFAVLANTQKKGRGRLGRSWHSPKGGNLYLSMGFRPDVDLIKLRSFTLWQGLKIAMLLRSLTGIEGISVKWPNDLVYEQKKIGGMLTEASIDCERVRSLVFGIGLNVNCPKSRFPASLAKIATSIESATGQTFRIHEIAAKIIKTTLDAYEDCVTGGIESALMEKWNEWDALAGQKVQISMGKEKITGKAMGIDLSGGLRVKLRNGRVRIVQAGEVTLRR